MNAPNTNRWIGIGLFGLPLYGALTFWSSLDPQPDPNIHSRNGLGAHVGRKYMKSGPPTQARQPRAA